MSDRGQADFELAVYLVAAARDSLEGPPIYASLQMIEAVSQLLTSVTPQDEFLVRAKSNIDREKHKVMGQRAEFATWLDDLLRDFAAEAKRRAQAET